MKRGYAEKTSLTPMEKLKAAYAHEVHGVSQHAIASLYGVNQGRIADAVSSVRKAVGISQDISINVQQTPASPSKLSQRIEL